MDDRWDCQSCGACCASLDVWLDEADRERFERSPRLLALTVLRRPGAAANWDWRFLRRDARTGRCVALAGPLRDCRCTIYADRPHLCRAFEAGSDECRKARRAVHGAIDA